ncbi:MAG TPA: PAS domain S-box protein, partial [Roseivirga sp.]
YSILGLENNEVLGTSENFIKRVHPSDREKLLTASERSIKTGIASRLELRVLTSDDSYKWIEASGNVKLNEAGNPTLLIGGVADITKRKILELQLKNFVEYAPAYIAMFDRHMNYLIASALWCEFFGLDANEIKGKSAIKVNGTKNQVTSKSNEERWRKIHEKGLQGKEATIKAEKFILDNTEYMIDWKIKPWYVDKNEVGGIIIKLADVTEYIKK